jgi:hypothetical protein
MKRLIDGVLYDTDGATKIGEGSYRVGGFADYEESLYRIKGRSICRNDNEVIYFLAGWGGAQSHYMEQVGNNYNSGEGIIILGSSKDEDIKDKVLDWIGKHYVDDELVKVLTKSGLHSWLKQWTIKLEDSYIEGSKLP